MLTLLLVALAMTPAITAFECGLANPDPTSTARVIGGQAMTYLKYPWFAVLHLPSYKLDRPNVASCAGALISPQFVMTAAHCYGHHLGIPKKMQYKVTLGAFSQCQATPGAITYTIKNVYLHPYHFDVYSSYDIALAKLDGTSQLMPVCLPPQGAPIQHVDNALVAGFGRQTRDPRKKTNQPCEMNEVAIDIFTDEECREQLETNNNKVANQEVTFCAGKKEGEAGTCKADGGGPILVEKNNRYFALGVVPFYEFCSKKGISSVITNVASFIDWINETMGGELEMYQ